MKKIKNFLNANKMFFAIAWKKHKSYYFLYIISIIYSVLNNMILVYLPQLSLTAFMEKNNFLLGVSYICASILISVIWSYFERKIAVVQSLNTTDIALEMQDKIYDKINRNNLLAYEDNNQFDALSRALNYSNVGADEVINVLSRLLTCIFTILGVSYVIGKISFVMVIIIIASLLFAHFCMTKVNKLWFDYQQNERLPKVRFVNFLSGLFHNKDYVTEMKLHNAFPFSIDLLKTRRTLLAEEGAKNDIQRFRWNYLAILTNNFQLLSAYIYFGYLLFSKTINVATYSTLFAAIQQFSSSFGSLLGIITEMDNKVNEATFYMNYLSDDTYEQKGNINISSMEKVEFKNVYFNYPNQLECAIDNISLIINAGEKIAVVGENGSGKTTFVKLLLGLYPPTSGSIVINQDIDLNEVDLVSWHNKIASVMQNSVHLPLTIKEDIALRCDDEIDEQMLRYAIDFSGLTAKIEALNKGENSIISKQFDNEGTDFSGGEKQKLSIARAFYKSAKILVFDEPSSALDPNSEYDFFQRIYDMGKDKTVIFVSHRLSTVVKADKILVFRNGKIAECGNHNELMAMNGLYSEMYNKQASNFLDG